MSTALSPDDILGVDDVWEMPYDGRRQELVDGAIIVTPAPGFAHQRAGFKLAMLLDAAAPGDVVVVPAPFDWVAGPHSLFQPDVLVARRADVGESAWSVRPCSSSRCSRPARATSTSA